MANEVRLTGHGSGLDAGDRSQPLEVMPALFIGNLRASQNREFLDAHGVTHVLIVANDIAPEFPKRYKYKIINVDDSTEDDLAQHFEKCCRFIDKARKSGAVLVHCHAGISRSPSIAIAYIMYKQQNSFEAALALLKSKDALYQPNEAFVTQLRSWETRLRSAPLLLEGK